MTDRLKLSRFNVPVGCDEAAGIPSRVFNTATGNYLVLSGDLVTIYRKLLSGEPVGPENGGVLHATGIAVEEGIDVIKRSGGIPVLAHPVFIKERKWLDIIVDSGIQGFEAISTYHNKSEVEFYMEFARKHGLLITAGSDFYGPSSKPKIKLGAQAGMKYDYFEKLKDCHEKTG